MFEKVNPCHPNKIADRIAGALVDYAYKMQDNPNINIEVMIGHGKCFVMAETSIHIEKDVVEAAVKRISQNNDIDVYYIESKRDKNDGAIKCSDIGVFKAVPLYEESKYVSSMARRLHSKYKSAGKVMYDENDVVLGVCQSNATDEDISNYLKSCERQFIGHFDDTFGASNKECFSDMGDLIGSHGLHGKDLSNPNVSVAIYTFLKAQKSGDLEEVYCNKGCNIVDGIPYSDITKIAKDYIVKLGGFEKLAEWGLT